MAEQQLDAVDRHVKAQIAVPLYKGYLGYVPVNREWENVCEVCWGDGCAACNRTGEKL